MEQIMEYIRQQYHPLSIILYGSYADGTNNLNSDFIQIFDGKIIADYEDKGKILQNRVLSYLEERQYKSKEEIQANIDWCTKMFERAKRCDAEGMFRWHWVLIDSLEIFCDMTRHPYFGPKKSLKWMKENYPASYVCYEKALKDFSMESLENWISHLKTFEYF